MFVEMEQILFQTTKYSPRNSHEALRETLRINTSICMVYNQKSFKGCLNHFGGYKIMRRILLYFNVNS